MPGPFPAPKAREKRPGDEVEPGDPSTRDNVYPYNSCSVVFTSVAVVNDRFGRWVSPSIFVFRALIPLEAISETALNSSNFASMKM